MTLSLEAIENLRKISTASLSLFLLKKEYRNGWMRGPRPLALSQPRTVGVAFTVRYIPARWPVSDPRGWSSRTRDVLDKVPENSFVVVDAMGMTEAGIFGDLILAGLVQRGAVGLVTDGVMRDLDDVTAIGLPVWCHASKSNSAVSSAIFTASVGSQEPIACGGAAVYPGDVIVADNDGVVVIPPEFVDEFIELGVAEIEEEAWIRKELEKGVPMSGLHPMSPETRLRYEKEKSEASRIPK